MNIKFIRNRMVFIFSEHSPSSFFRRVLVLSLVLVGFNLMPLQMSARRAPRSEFSWGLGAGGAGAGGTGGPLLRGAPPIGGGGGGAGGPDLPPTGGGGGGAGGPAFLPTGGGGGGAGGPALPPTGGGGGGAGGPALPPLGGGLGVGGPALRGGGVGAPPRPPGGPGLGLAFPVFVGLALLCPVTAATFADRFGTVFCAVALGPPFPAAGVGFLLGDDPGLLEPPGPPLGGGGGGPEGRATLFFGGGGGTDDGLPPAAGRDGGVGRPGLAAADFCPSKGPPFPVT